MDPEREDLLRRERALRRAYEVLAGEAGDFAETIEAVLELGCEVLETEYATLSQVHPDAGTYLFERVAVPESSDLAPGTTTSLSDLPNCARVVETAETLVVENVPEQRPDLDDPTWDIACYLGAPVTVEDEVYGIFCFYDTEPRERAFSGWAVTFVELLADWTSRELERQRRLDRLEALDALNAIVRETATGALSEDSRSAIEATVCDHLAAADAYRGAWIGRADPDAEAVRVRTAAGLEAATPGSSVALDRRPAPAVRALQRVEPCRWQAIPAAEPEDLPAFATPACRTVLAVPITYEGIVRGTISVHSDRNAAFDGNEREVLADFGELLGHTIATTERERVVRSGAASELTVRIRDALADVAGPEAVPESVVVEDLIRRGERGFVAYATTSPEDFDSLRSLVREHPDLDDVSRLGTGADAVAVQVTGGGFPVFGRVFSLGGTVERVVFEGSDVLLTVHLPTETDAREVVEAGREHYPDATILSLQSVTRPDRSVDRAEVLADLTDRQLAAIRAAHAAGYYDRPREANAREVADALDISGATFSQHRRAAERKLLEALFEDSGD